ncbi:MAG TPA: diiron oxygenase [Jatrophihabitantaceae bacterium]|nr:diiron oxygenase [Jatrophihabitantaceae bacterium]
MDAQTRTATRLLGSSARNSYDPDLDIDWSAPVDLDLAYLPFERVSLYGTQLWDRLSHAQRLELSKQELASVASTGLWFEIILIQLLARYAYHCDPQDPHTQYALTEIGDETRHIIMFAKALDRLGTPTYRPNRFVHNLARLYKATARGTALFAPVLVAEEVTDRLQRATMNDESIHPLVRMVNRIHVVEEARHVRFAREEVARLMPRSGRLTRLINNTLAAVVSAFVISVLINPQVYAAVGLDPRQAARVARKNPQHRQTRRWLAEKIMAFLAEQGMLTWTARPIYRFAHLI